MFQKKRVCFVQVIPDSGAACVKRSPAARVIWWHDPLRPHYVPERTTTFQRVEAADTNLNFLTLLFIGNYTAENRSMSPLQSRAGAQYGKPPAARNWYSSSLARACSESSCDVYEVENAALRQTLHAYLWVATGTGAIDGSTYHRYWFNVVAS